MSDVNPSAPQPQPRVLVVEDDPLLYGLLSQRLEQEHFDFAGAMSGEDALERLKSGPKPDLILLDIILPGMDGFEVLKRIKEDQRTADILVIILSNLYKNDDIEKGKRLGADRFVVKVSTPLEDVVALLRSVWKEKHP